MSDAGESRRRRWRFMGRLQRQGQTAGTLRPMTDGQIAGGDARSRSTMFEAISGSLPGVRRRIRSRKAAGKRKRPPPPRDHAHRHVDDDCPITTIDDVVVRRRTFVRRCHQGHQIGQRHGPAAPRAELTVKAPERRVPHTASRLELNCSSRADGSLAGDVALELQSWQRKGTTGRSWRRLQENSVSGRTSGSTRGD